MFGLGIPELIIILIIVFLIFGASRLPEIIKSLGKAVKEFKEAKREVTDDVIKEVIKDKPNEKRK